MQTDFHLRAHQLPSDTTLVLLFLVDNHITDADIDIIVISLHQEKFYNKQLHRLLHEK